MAIFSMNIAKISKADGKSAVNSSAYLHREKYRAEETGLLYDWTSKAKEEAHVFSEMLLPDNAPERYKDPQVLWNAVEKIEKQSNALLARRIIVALPKELSVEQNHALLVDYCKENFVREGMCADIAIHWKDDNPHAHIMLTTRPIKENGQWGAKEKKIYKLDENGERIPVIDQKTGKQKLDSRNRKQWQRETVETFSVNHKNMAEEWRASWAEHCNRFLEKENQIDHRSYERQGIDVEPQIHMGYSLAKAKINAMIKKTQEKVKSLAKEIKALKNAILSFADEKIYIRVPKHDTKMDENGEFISAFDDFSFRFDADKVSDDKYSENLYCVEMSKNEPVQVEYKEGRIEKSAEEVKLFIQEFMNMDPLERRVMRYMREQEERKPELKAGVRREKERPARRKQKDFDIEL